MGCGSNFTLHGIQNNLWYPDIRSRLSSLHLVFRLPPSSLGPTCNTRGDDTKATDELRRHVHPQRNHIGPVYTAHSVFVCVAGLSPVCVRARSNWKKMRAILVAPIRGCAHVKVYLKWFNEALPNGSWSCRHTSLTLFHWRQRGGRECRGSSPGLGRGGKKTSAVCRSKVSSCLWFLTLLSDINCCPPPPLFLREVKMWRKPFSVAVSSFQVQSCVLFVFPTQRYLCLLALLSSLFSTLAHCFISPPPIFPVCSPPPWTQCTTSCGPGYQMRAVKCVVGSYGAVMDDTECNAATRPTDTQVRNTLSALLLASLSFISFFPLLFL